MTEKFKKKENYKKSRLQKKPRLNGKLNVMKNFKLLETKLKTKCKNFNKDFKNFKQN